jgi:hypothetical protein
LPNEALPQPGGSLATIQNRFIELLKPPFKSSDDYRQIGWGKKPESPRKGGHSSEA